MRNSQNMFGTDHDRRRGMPAFSGIQILTIVLSVISAVIAIMIAANFGAVTARIAIGIVNLLSTGLPILIVIGIAVFLIARIRWRMRRRFWGW